MPYLSTLPTHVPILIAGGGPVGLTLAALLARYGVPSVIIESDESYCTGSRAICLSRRSQEIFSWIGAEQALLDKGLSWVGGRSYFRNHEVLHFQMPTEPTQRFAPMLNIQQYYVEQFAYEAGQRLNVQARSQNLMDVRWNCKIISVKSMENGAQILVQTPQGEQLIHADWLVACDGGRSTVRDQLGLNLEGTQYDGNYVIVDIQQKTKRAVERLAWFDPPSNPGSTILMHRQPNDVWRIDYQIADDENVAEAIKPENVLPRVQSHLSMIGENEPWQVQWISAYNAKCLTLPRYRYGRVLFAGDAAHLVPIFGVRGLNSGLDDASNLAWKLALTVKNHARAVFRHRPSFSTPPSTPESTEPLISTTHHECDLLDTYSLERVHAARENIAYGAKSTEFMAPPHEGFKLMRAAALRLSVHNERLRSLINPRQSLPIEYVNSPLNISVNEPDNALPHGSAHPGMPAPEALLHTTAGAQHLSQHYGNGFVLLYFAHAAHAPETAQNLCALQAEINASAQSSNVPAQLTVLCVQPNGMPSFPNDLEHTVIEAIDAHQQAWQRYDAQHYCVYLIRPDAYVLGRWRAIDCSVLRQALQPFLINLAECAYD